MTSANVEPNDADRCLLVRLPARDLIEGRGDERDERFWSWRYAGPAEDPIGPRGSVEEEAGNLVVTYVSSLYALERLGWVWRGVRRSDMRRGWGLTPAGLAERHRLIAAGELERWRSNELWWRELARSMSEMVAGEREGR